MANQDTLTIGGIGADPSRHSQIETGWNPTYADGAVTWLPSSAGLTTAVADTGSVVQTSTKGSATTGFTVNGGGNDTFQIQDVPAGSTVTTTGSTVSIVATANSGSDGTSTAEAPHNVAGGELASISSSGLITFTGTGGFANNFEGVITYEADIDEPVVTTNYQPLPVTGAKNLTLYHPATGNAEVTAKFQWTDDDILSIGGVEQATWTDVAAAGTGAMASTLLDPSDNATWAKLDKMKYIRLVLISTDDNIDGVANVASVFEHASTGASIKYALSNTLESNTGVVSIGGIGVDPS